MTNDSPKNRGEGLVLTVPTDDAGRGSPDVRTVRLTTGGPVLVQGPVRIEAPNGDVVESDRFLVAICTCRRSKAYPLCDTSHRRKRRAGDGSDELTP